MTLENLKEALYLNNVILLNKIKALKDSIDDIISVDIETLKNLIDNINDNIGYFNKILYKTVIFVNQHLTKAKKNAIIALTQN